MIRTPVAEEKSQQIVSRTWTCPRERASHASKFVLKCPPANGGRACQAGTVRSTIAIHRRFEVVKLSRCCGRATRHCYSDCPRLRAIFTSPAPSSTLGLDRTAGFHQANQRSCIFDSCIAPRLDRGPGSPARCNRPGLRRGRCQTGRGGNRRQKP